MNSTQMDTDTPVCAIREWQFASFLRGKTV